MILYRRSCISLQMLRAHLHHRNVLIMSMSRLLQLQLEVLYRDAHSSVVLLDWTDIEARIQRVSVVRVSYIYQYIPINTEC
jgi:hypothetical protein